MISLKLFSISYHQSNHIINNKMPKRKSSYKTYLWDKSVSIPEKTRTNLMKKLKQQINCPGRSPTASNHNDHVYEEPLDVISDQNNIQNNCQEENIANQDETQENSNYDHDSNQTDLENSLFETNTAESEEPENNNELSYLNQILQNTISNEEIAAAYLVAFFSGSVSQKSLADFLYLSNMYSSTKLPTTINGLAKLLTGQSPNLIYKKTWYCGVCFKNIEELNSRFQRNCTKCNNR